MNVKLYMETRVLFCAMCITLIAACPMPEPEPTVPGTIGAPDLKAGNEELIATWTAPNNGGSEITTYHLHHSADGGTTWSEIIVLAAPAANYTIMDLRNAAEYHVQARAVNAVGAGPWSESAVTTLPATATPPATVPDAPAAPTLYAGTGRIVARWSEPEDNGGSKITGYELIYREVGVTAWTDASGITGTDHTYTMTNLTNGAIYQVQMRAINAEGAGPWSPPATESPLFSTTAIPSGEEGSISLLAADNALYIIASIANENLNISVFVTTVELGATLTVEEGDLKVTPATAPAGVTIPTVDPSTGIVTVTASTTAGKYVVYGETGSGDIVFAEYLYVTESPTTNAELKTAVTNGISNWGNTADFNYIITTAVTNMSNIFQNISAFNGDISLWDVSKVTNMYSMFGGSSTFNGDISGWNVSSVTDISGMFAYATAFNHNISGWDVSSVTNMEGMFNNAIAFTQNLEEWKEHWTPETGNKLTTADPPKYTGNKSNMFKSSGVTTPPTWY
ncbi:MAG: BspA family leucine-rich repeat surface protein [Salinispira sp.]